MTDSKKFMTIKYGSLALALCLLIWQIIDIYVELKTFPAILGGKRNYLVITIALSVLLYFLTNHKDFLFQHILSAINLLLSLYNVVVLGLGYKVAPDYIHSVANDATIFAHTTEEAIQSMKVLLIVALIAVGAIFMWYVMVVYHNKIEKEQN